jgi:DNA-binding response OmpR family regulator
MVTNGRVLLIEDNPETVESVGIALIDAGYEVVIAQDGATALSSAISFQPHVIILDMRLPVMDGLTFLKMYQDIGVPRAPVVVMTASPSLAEDAQAFDIAASFLKPFDIPALLDCIEKLLPAAGAVG